jgi:hypothetical protein
MKAVLHLRMAELVGQRVPEAEAAVEEAVEGQQARGDKVVLLAAAHWARPLLPVTPATHWGTRT